MTSWLVCSANITPHCWRKTIAKTPGYKGAYKTIDEAKQGLQQFCKEQLNPATAMQD